MALSTKRTWLLRFAPARPGWLDLAGLRAAGRPGWLDLAALCAPGGPAGSIWLLEKRGPVQRNVDFAAQRQCFVDVALVASMWVLCVRAPGRPGCLDLAALRAPGRPGWLGLAALGDPGRPGWLALRC